METSIINQLKRQAGVAVEKPNQRAKYYIIEKQESREPKRIYRVEGRKN